jgi:hypothetical protein
MRVLRQRRFQLETLERRDAPGAFGGVSVVPASLLLERELRDKISARGHGQITKFDQGTGQVSTSGCINEGLLRGKTQFSAQIIDQEGNYVGSTTIVAIHGLVYLNDEGTLNANGTFTDHATITGGTHRFKGATGSLVFQGHELADGVHFVDDCIAGMIDLRSRTEIT